MKLFRLVALLAFSLLLLAPSTQAGIRDSEIVFAAAQTNIYDGYSRAGYARSSYGGRWDLYSGYSRAGYIKRSYGGRWNVYEGYSRVGYVTRSYDGRWNIYEGYSRIGYAKRSYGSRTNIYSGYSRVGYVNGTNAGPVAGGALLLGITG